MGQRNTDRQAPRPDVRTVSLHYEERMVLRDDIANAPPLGEFAQLRLRDQILAALDTQIGKGFLGYSPPTCECGSALIQGARLCIDCGAAVPQQPPLDSTRVLGIPATGPTRRLESE